MHHFKGSADSYHKARPGYPPELFLALVNYWKKFTNNLKQMPTIIDVGCGTGIASRGIYDAFAQQCKVFGIDPDLAMLAEAKKATLEDTNLIYLEGQAEKLPLANKSADIVMAAQAIHYFKRPDFYGEVKRVLSPGGTLAILENNRNWRDSEFLARYEQLLENNTQSRANESYKRDYRKFSCIDELNQHFYEPLELSFPWIHKMTPTDFLELARSTTSAQRAMDNSGKEEVEQAILRLAQEYGDGELEILYTAKLYLAHN